MVYVGQCVSPQPIVPAEFAIVLGMVHWRQQAICRHAVRESEKIPGPKGCEKGGLQLRIEIEGTKVRAHKRLRPRRQREECVVQRTRKLTVMVAVSSVRP